MSWGALRSGPCRPSLRQHLGALVLTLGMTSVLGGAIMLLSLVGIVFGGGPAPLVYMLGLVFVMAPLLSWAGHLPGALLLHRAMVMGYGGWFVAALAGAGVGCVLALGYVDLPLAGVVAVIGAGLAVLHGQMLRVVTRRAAASGAT